VWFCNVYSYIKPNHSFLQLKVSSAYQLCVLCVKYVAKQYQCILSCLNKHMSSNMLVFNNFSPAYVSRIKIRIRIYHVFILAQIAYKRSVGVEKGKQILVPFRNSQVHIELFKSCFIIYYLIFFTFCESWNYIDKNSIAYPSLWSYFKLYIMVNWPDKPGCPQTIDNSPVGYRVMYQGPPQAQTALFELIAIFKPYEANNYQTHLKCENISIEFKWLPDTDYKFGSICKCLEIECTNPDHFNNGMHIYGNHLVAKLYELQSAHVSCINV